MKNNYINKLIANDIVDTGIKETNDFNYIVDLESYCKDLNSEEKNYIDKNIDDIKDKIESNKKVLAVFYNEKDKEFDMVFYIENVFDRVENIIYSVMEEQEKKLSYYDIKSIADEVLESDSFNSDIYNRVDEKDGEYEI